MQIKLLNIEPIPKKLKIGNRHSWIVTRHHPSKQETCQKCGCIKDTDKTHKISYEYEGITTDNARQCTCKLIILNNK